VEPNLFITYESDLPSGRDRHVTVLQPWMGSRRLWDRLPNKLSGIAFWTICRYFLITTIFYLELHQKALASADAISM
jgi:hypothetical protein